MKKKELIQKLSNIIDISDIKTQKSVIFDRFGIQIDYTLYFNINNDTYEIYINEFNDVDIVIKKNGKYKLISEIIK